MKILLVWNIIPDTTELYVLDMESVAGQWALASAGKYINKDDIDEGDPLNLLNNWLATEEGTGCLVEGGNTTGIATGPFLKVAVCGFHL